MFKHLYLLCLDDLYWKCHLYIELTFRIVQTEHLDHIMDSDFTESDESDNENSDTDISKVILPGKQIINQL